MDLKYLFEVVLDSAKRFKFSLYKLRGYTKKNLNFS